MEDLDDGLVEDLDDGLEEDLEEDLKEGQVEDLVEVPSADSGCILHSNPAGSGSPG